MEKSFIKSNRKEENNKNISQLVVEMVATHHARIQGDVKQYNKQLGLIEFVVGIRATHDKTAVENYSFYQFSGVNR